MAPVNPAPAPVVTAVGRLLQPKGGEPRVLERIKVDSEGRARRVVRLVLPSRREG